MTSWPIVLGVLEFLLRRAQHVVIDLNCDEDDFELDGPISRDKENDPFELILMGYKTLMSKIDSADQNSSLEQIQEGYQIVFTLYKVGRVFPLVIWSNSRMGQYRDDHHREDAPQFSKA